MRSDRRQTVARRRARFARRLGARDSRRFFGDFAMDDSNLKVWVILGVPLLAIAAYYFGLLGETDRQKFDELKVGMTAAQVRDILFPRSGGGKYAAVANAHRTQIRDYENLYYNNCMTVIIRDGVLVEKEWTGPEVKSKDATPK